MFTENNWYKWKYGLFGDWFGEPDGQLTLHTEYGRIKNYVPETFKQAMLDNAGSTVDHFPGEKFNLLFSGGVDSEAVLRSYLEIGHPIEVTIFRYEKGYNAYDVNNAIRICEALDMPYNVIDFNLGHFFLSEEALEIAKKAKVDRPRALPYMKFLDLVDGFPILASADPYFKRVHNDPKRKADWLVIDYQHDIAWDVYAHKIGRKAIMQWYKWTPELTLGWYTLDWFKRLTTDQIPGKLASTTSKGEGFREAFPGMFLREKRSGFEAVDHLLPDLNKVFNKKVTDFYPCYRYEALRSVGKLWEEMTGEPYHG